MNIRPRSSQGHGQVMLWCTILLEIPGEPRETVSIPTEASTSTLWIERECAAVVVVFLFVGFQSFHLHIHCFNLAQENKSSISLPHFHGSGAVSSIHHCFG